MFAEVKPYLASCDCTLIAKRGLSGAPLVKAGQQWFGRVLLWQDKTIATYLSAVWDEEHREAWFLISDQPAGWRRVQEYRLRMRVESTFQDTKSRGWDLEASLIADLERLNRLLLALFVVEGYLAPHA